MKVIIHSVILLGLAIASVYLLLGCGAQNQHPAEAGGQAVLEWTLAEDMLALESQYIDIPQESVDLLQEILNEGVAALGDNPTQPTTPEEALAASRAVSDVFIKNNFYQPTNDQPAPVTIGQALTPVSLSEDEISSLLDFGANAQRAEDFDPDQPIYLVDCDMGSLLMMSVFERLGWDTRLVKAPVHMFLRWHLPDGTTVNWDWSSLNSFEDHQYLLARETTAREQVLQRTYLASLSRDEAKGNFMGLIGDLVYDTEAAVNLLRRALKLGPNNPGILNDLAWIYATDADLSQEYGAVAVMYAHRAVAADLVRVDRLGTLACAYAAVGQWEFAKAIYSTSADDIQLIEPEASVYIFNRISEKRLCDE